MQYIDDGYELGWECNICNAPLSQEGYLCDECEKEEEGEDGGII